MGRDRNCAKWIELQSVHEAPPRGTLGEYAASPRSDFASSTSQTKLSSKELRKQRAAERAKYAPQMKELKKRVATAEQKLDELQKALDEASAELFNPKPTTNFEEVNRTVRTLQFEIDRYTADWEEAATALEQLTNNG